MKSADTRVGDPDESMAPAFSLAQVWLLWAFRNELVEERFLCLCLSVLQISKNGKIFKNRKGG